MPASFPKEGQGVGRRYAARVAHSRRAAAHVSSTREAWAGDDLRTVGIASRADLRLGLTSGAGGLTRRRCLHLAVVDHACDPRDAPRFLLRLGLHLGIGHLPAKVTTPLVILTSTALSSDTTLPRRTVREMHALRWRPGVPRQRSVDEHSPVEGVPFHSSRSWSTGCGVCGLWRGLFRPLTPGRPSPAGGWCGARKGRRKPGTPANPRLSGDIERYGNVFRTTLRPVAPTAEVPRCR